MAIYVWLCMHGCVRMAMYFMTMYLWLCMYDYICMAMYVRLCRFICMHEYPYICIFYLILLIGVYSGLGASRTTNDLDLGFSGTA